MQILNFYVCFCEFIYEIYSFFSRKFVLTTSSNILLYFEWNVNFGINIQKNLPKEVGDDEKLSSREKLPK